MIKPLVSIGLPVVKTEFLEESIRSCLSQSYDNFELIIQNNAKHKSEKGRIKNIVSKFIDSRIRYFENEVQIPMIQNWNSILNKVKGDYFSILCDDDYWENEFLQEIINVAKVYKDTNIFHSRIAIIDNDGKIVRITENYPEYEEGIDFIYNKLKGYRSTYLSDFVVKTTTLREIGGFVDLPDGWGSDTITWFKISLNGGIGYTPKILCKYRVSNINVSNSKSNRNKHLAIEQMRDILKEILLTIDENNDYALVRKKMLEQELKKFRSRSKSFLVKQTLTNKYKISSPTASLLALIYKQFII